jgi:hypothetical protein
MTDCKHIASSANKIWTPLDGLSVNYARVT